VRLLLIRHGQTPHNVAGALDTAFPGAGLTGLGHRQAEAVPRALAGEPLAGVYASPLVRTQLTAAPLATERGLDAVVRDGLEEISAGDLELRSDEEAVRAYHACLGAWLRGDLDHALPGGGTGHQFLQRYGAAIAAIAARHGDATVAVFSHGAAIRVFTALATGLPGEEAADLRLLNTGMAVLEGDPSAGWALTRWRSEPLGGADLADETAHDVTGEAADEAIDEATEVAEESSGVSGG
jgi:probable phosphoglycerate mutase